MLKQDNIYLVIKPCGMTLVLQPLNVGVNEPMKLALRKIEMIGWQVTRGIFTLRREMVNS